MVRTCSSARLQHIYIRRNFQCLARHKNGVEEAEEVVQVAGVHQLCIG